MPQTLHIKNMVCPRCISAVREILQSRGLTVTSVTLGEASVSDNDEVDSRALDRDLRKHGFELLREKNQQLVETIKTALIEFLVELERNEKPKRISHCLTQRLQVPYTQLSRIFSREVGHTIERHLILLKIERVKELVSYGEQTLSEIAFRLRYSSVHHLSTQFKQITGLSVTEYKNLSTRHRHPLDAIS